MNPGHNTAAYSPPVGIRDYLGDTRVRVPRAFRVPRDPTRRATGIARYNPGSFPGVWTRAARLTGIRAKKQREGR